MFDSAPGGSGLLKLWSQVLSEASNSSEPTFGACG